MPRTARNKETNGDVPKFLEDGHPNPDYFPLDGEGYEAFQAALDEKRLWGDYFGKLYRVKPLRSTEDKPPRVCKFASTLTMEQIEKNYGGRKWSAWVTRKKGTHEMAPRIFQFDIEAPAIYQDDEHSEDTAARKSPNGQVATADTAMLKTLMEDLIGQRDRAQTEGKQFDLSTALQNALSLQHQAFSSALTSVSEGVGKGDNAAIGALTTLVSELIKANTARKDDPIMQALVQRALEKPQNPLAEITTLLGLLRDLGIRIGPAKAAEAASGSEWAGVVEKVVDRVPDLINGAAKLITMRGQQPQPAAPGARGILPMRPMTPVQPMEPAATAGASAQPPATPVAPAAPAAGGISPELAEAIAQDTVKTGIVRMLFNGDSGEDAAHFANMAHPLFAKHLADVLKNNPAQLQTDPILSQAVAHVSVMQFAQEYVAYFEKEQTEEAEAPAPEPEAQPAAATA